jgi:hypothetical protein
MTSTKINPELRHITQHPDVVAAAERHERAIAAHDTARQRLQEATEAISTAELAVIAGEGDIAALHRARADAAQAKSDMDLHERAVSLARQGIDAARERARAEIAEAVRPQYAEAVRELAEAIEAAAVKNRAVLDLWLQVTELCGGKSALPEVHWKQLLEPSGSMGSTKLEAWRSYVAEYAWLRGRP